MNDIYEEIEQIKADIDHRVKHPYLMKFIDVPVIDEQKLVLLYTILKETKLPFEKVKQSIVATMLVQIALDTHEHVGIDRIDDDNPFMKKRQLTVLAGDYYSGLYYYLLALVNDIPMIKILSTAIKEINEHKITVYQKSQTDLKEFIDSVAMIDSLLIQKVAEYVNNHELKNLSNHLLLVNRLNQEKAKYQATGDSIIVDGMKTIQKQHQAEVLTMVDQQILKSIYDIEIFIQKHATSTYSFLAEKIKRFIEQLDVSMEKAVKEG